MKFSHIVGIHQMKIKEVKTFRLEFETGVRTIGANPIRIEVSPVLIVKICTDEGIDGYCATIFIT